MRRLLAAAALLLASACQPTPTAAQLPQPRPMQPRAEYAVAWDYVVACAGAIADSSTRYDGVKWFERDSIADSAGNLIIGEWMPPDSVVITVGYADSLWVVAHELLHHRLGAYNTADEPHPWIPFAFPCKLMDFQQTLAGIMQPTKHALRK